MTSNQIVPNPEAPANLAALVVELIRQNRTLKNEYVAAAELLSMALAMLRKADRERDKARENGVARAEECRRLRAENTSLRAELRRLEQRDRDDVVQPDTSTFDNAEVF
jgi:hypothetical protein